MSRPLVYAVAMSRHPLLMDDPTARDVLACMADLARDGQGGRIVASLASLAAVCERGQSAVRHARDRLIAAGLLTESGAGDTSKRAGVYFIAEDLLSGISKQITPEPSKRKQKGIAASPLPHLCRDFAASLPHLCRDFAAALPSTRARVLNKELEQEQEQHQECAGEPAPEHAEGNGEAKPVDKPYTLPAHPVADAMLAQYNAAAMAQRAKASSRQPVVAAQTALPIATTPEPDPVVEPDPAPKMSPGDARVAAALEEVWAIIAPKGQTAATLTTWRARLRSRLTAKGVSAEAVADRLDAVKRSWAYINANGWHIQERRNGPGHFFGVTLRSDEGLDKTASSKPEPMRGKGGQVARPWSAAGRPTAADVVADCDDEAEAWEMARLEAEAESQRARIAAVAPKPAPIEATPAPAPDNSPDPERIKAAFGEMTGMLGSFGAVPGTRPMAHNARNGAGVGVGKGEA